MTRWGKISEKKAPPPCLKYLVETRKVSMAEGHGTEDTRDNHEKYEFDNDWEVAICSLEFANGLLLRTGATSRDEQDLSTLNSI